MKEYTERSYRLLHRQQDLVFFQITVKETDLDVGVSRAKLTAGLVEGAEQEIIRVRSQLEKYIATDQTFLRTLKPYLPGPDAPRSPGLWPGPLPPPAPAPCPQWRALSHST